MFYGLPWLEWNGRPALLFDLAARRFYVFGLVLHPQDSVAVLKCPVKPGDQLVNGSIALTITQPIRAGHKIALARLAETADVFLTNTRPVSLKKYGLDEATLRRARARSR